MLDCSNSHFPPFSRTNRLQERGLEGGGEKTCSLNFYGPDKYYYKFYYKVKYFMFLLQIDQLIGVEGDKDKSNIKHWFDLHKLSDKHMWISAFTGGPWGSYSRRFKRKDRMNLMLIFITMVFTMACAYSSNPYKKKISKFFSSLNFPLGISSYEVSVSHIFCI